MEGKACMGSRLITLQLPTSIPVQWLTMHAFTIRIVCWVMCVYLSKMKMQCHPDQQVPLQWAGPRAWPSFSIQIIIVHDTEYWESHSFLCLMTWHHDKHFHMLKPQTSSLFKQALLQLSSGFLQWKWTLLLLSFHLMPQQTQSSSAKLVILADSLGISSIGWKLQTLKVC